MKMVVIGLAALLLLGGGAAGAYFFFGKKAEASAPESAEHEAAAAKEKEKKEAKGDGHGGDAHGGSSVNFVKLEPLVLPIIDEDGVSQVVSLVIVLEVEDQFIATEVRRMTPRLKDAYIQEMYGVLNRTASMEGGVLKVSEIKKKLNSITAKVMGENQVNDVLLEVVQQRPI